MYVRMYVRMRGCVSTAIVSFILKVARAQLRYTPQLTRGERFSISWQTQRNDMKFHFK
jgi:hypothetical protein